MSIISTSLFDDANNLVNEGFENINCNIVISSLSKDLTSIDVKLLSKYFEPIDKMKRIDPSSTSPRILCTEEEFFFELAVLCRDKSYAHPQWSLLSGRVRMLYIKRTSPKTFLESVKLMYPVLDKKYYKFCLKYKNELDNIINKDNDWKFDIFAVETLGRGYLRKIKDEKGYVNLAETPQYLYLRIAVFLWYPIKEKKPLEAYQHRSYDEKSGLSFEIGTSLGFKNIRKEAAIKTCFKNIHQAYDDFSKGKISAPSPLQFNAGTKRPQCSSCFLLAIEDDMQSISKSWHDTAIISMINGGIGEAFDALRHSEIGNNGWSKGIVPWIKIENEILSTIDQCFHPDTIVYTINDGPKCIKDIGPGEMLVRSDGKPNRVLQPIVYDIDKEKGHTFYKLSTENYSISVIISNLHPLLCINNQHQNISFQTILERLKESKVIMEYTSVENINDHSFIGTPIPSYEQDLPRYSNEDCRMYGILLGCGYMDNNEVSIKLRTSENKDLNAISMIDFVKNYLSKNGMNYDESLRENFSFIKWEPKHHLFPFTRQMIYDNNDEKHFHSVFLHLPIRKLENIFVGMMERNNYVTDSNFIYVICNYQLAESLRYILLRLKIIANIFKSNSFDKHIYIPKTRHVCELFGLIYVNFEVSFFEYDNKLWSRVTKKELIPKEKIDFKNVYDLEMEYPTDNTDAEITANYATCIGTCHNGGLRKGSGTMYTCDWNIDIYEFIDLKEPTGKEELRARDLFYGIMISDLFMDRVSKDEMWSLFCPAKTSGLEKTFGFAFEEKYLELEREGLKGKFALTFRQIRARDLWSHIMRSQIKTGMPFIIYKDAVNRKSNQKNLGTIRSSNLCCEIVEYTDKDNIASCNLASIPISQFVKEKEIDHFILGVEKTTTLKKYFDFEELGHVTRRTLRNLKQVIDRNYYPEDVPQIKYSNLRNRPIGVGIQDLAGCFALMDLCWDSEESMALNEKIAQVMYYHGMDENVKMAEEFGHHDTFPKSPASQGFFQYDLWAFEEIERLCKRENENMTGKCRKNYDENDIVSDSENDMSFSFKEKDNAYFLTDNESMEICRKYQPKYPGYDWIDLRKRMIHSGLYFSLVFAQMPTASSAHILGNNESIEPYSRLLYARTVLSGQFVICVPHLVRDLEKIGLWNDKMLRHLFQHQGSIQSFIDDDLNGDAKLRLQYLKKKYKTAFELSQKTLADLYLARAKYQCQSSSNNVFMKNPTMTKLSAYLFYMWRGGAKTGMYYLHQGAGSDPINFSLDSLSTTSIEKVKEKEQQILNHEELIYLEQVLNHEELICLACSS